jgi:hypothetical protein
MRGEQRDDVRELIDVCTARLCQESATLSGGRVSA